MPILVNSSNDCLVYIHIPKTGGTALKLMISNGVTLSLNHESKRELPCPPQHFQYELLERLGVFNSNAQSFTVCRHPINRFISEYAYRKKIEPKYRFISLTTFVFLVTRAYAHNPYILANHIRPQVDFIGEHTKVFSLENGLGAIIEAYPEFFDENKLSTEKVNKSDSECVSIDPRALECLTQFYRADMDKFGYNEPSVKVCKEASLLFFFRKLNAFLLSFVYRVFK